MFCSLILDSNKKVTNWISIRISSKNIELFDTNLEPTMSNLASGRVTLKFDNSVLVQKMFYSFYSNFMLNLYIVYELSNCPRNPANDFTLKNSLFGTDKLTRNRDKKVNLLIMVEE